MYSVTIIESESEKKMIEREREKHQELKRKVGE